jgi:glycosyltransferase involved in cell wall biosynthesis
MLRRILHISKYYAPFCGGTEQVAHNAVEALKDFAEQKVICFNHEVGNKIDCIDDVEIIRCHCEKKLFSQPLALCFEKKLHALISEFKPGIVIFHYPNPFVAYFLLKHLPRNVKLIVYWHLDITRQKILGKIFHLQNKALLHRADAVIATSPNYVIGSKYLNQVTEKCTIIPNCIDEKRLALSEEISKLAEKIKQENLGKIGCLAVGRHVPYKGFEYLVKASKLLDDRFVINIIGEGEQTQKLKKMAFSDDKIKFLGKKTDSELKAYYLASDIFCFSSITKNEAFGIALAEAMYFGLPAVTFTINGSGVNYVSINGKTGIEVPNENVEEYANALKELADRSDLRKKYGKEAAKRVAENFLFSQYKQALIRLVIDGMGNENQVCYGSHLQEAFA